MKGITFAFASHGGVFTSLRFVQGVFGSVNISRARYSLKNAFHQPNRMERFALSYEELSLQVKSKLWVHYGHRYICTEKSLFGSRKKQILTISLVKNNPIVLIWYWYILSKKKTNKSAHEYLNYLHLNFSPFYFWVGIAMPTPFHVYRAVSE